MELFLENSNWVMLGLLGALAGGVLIVIMFCLGKAYGELQNIDQYFESLKVPDDSDSFVQVQHSRLSLKRSVEILRVLVASFVMFMSAIVWHICSAAGWLG